MCCTMGLLVAKKTGNQPDYVLVLTVVHTSRVYIQNDDDGHTDTKPSNHFRFFGLMFTVINSNYYYFHNETVSVYHTFNDLQ